MPFGDYPRTAEETLTKPVEFEKDTLNAIIRFKEKNPWQGTSEERFQKFKELNEALNVIYKQNVSLSMENITGGYSGESSYNRITNSIILRGKLSVVTYLHEYAHALEKDERESVRWSLNLFKQTFPVQFSKLVSKGHTMVKHTTFVPGFDKPIKVDKYYREDGTSVTNYRRRLPR